MKLPSFIVVKKIDLNKVVILFLFAITANNTFVVADSLTYSPDQWPRHWKVLINGDHQQGGIVANRNYQNHYGWEKPARSPSWGMLPNRRKPRRSTTPEYNTNSHLIDYSGLNTNYRPYHPGAYYPGLASPGLASPFAGPLVNPYTVPVLAPGLGSPVTPYSMYPSGAYPYASAYPGVGVMPGRGYLW